MSITVRIKDLATISNPDNGSIPLDRSDLSSAQKITTNDLRSWMLSGLNAGKLVYVDSVNGNNSTGTRGKISLPFLTLTAAKAAAASGDTIIVYPGTYNEINLLKDGVNWHFTDGAIVDYTGSTEGSIFDDSSLGANGPVTCNITGFGEFKNRTTTTTYGTENNNCVLLTNADSNVSIEGKLLYAEWSDDTFGHSNTVCAIRHNAGTLNVDANFISGIGPGRATAIWWQDGELHVHANVITSAYSGIYIAPTSNVAANAWVTADLLKTTDFSGVIGGIIYFTGSASPEMKLWANIKEIRGAVVSVNGKLYLTTNKISTPYNTSAINISGTLNAWITVQKLTTGSFITGAIISPSSGFVSLNIDHIEDGGSSNCLVLSGNVSCNVGRLIPVGGGTGVTVSSGAYFSGSVDASGGTAIPLSVGDGAIIGDCNLLSDGIVDCIGAGGPVTIRSVGNISINSQISSDVTIVADQVSFAPGGASNDNQVIFNDNGLNASSPNLAFNGSTFSIGNPTIPGSYVALHAAGSDTLGFGVSIICENKSNSGTVIAQYLMKTVDGTNDGTFFGCKSTSFAAYGIVNGITMRPGQTTQDLALACGNNVSGSLTGPILLIKPSGRMGIGDTSSLITSDATYGQVSIVTLSSSHPCLVMYGASSQSVGVFEVRNNSNQIGLVIRDSGMTEFWKITTGSPTNRAIADFTQSWATSTDASRKGRLVFNIYDTAAREAIRLEASGTAPMIGFFGSAAAVQPAGTGETTGFTAGSGTAVNDDSTFTGNIGATAYRINDIVKALKQLGLLAS